jgi:hypothetical protein
MCLIVSCRAIA